MWVVSLELSFVFFRHEYWGLSKTKQTKKQKARPQAKVTSEFFKKYIPLCPSIIYFVLLRDLDHYFINL